MLKRDKRNIGKLVRIIPHGTVADNRIGKVIAFRGDFRANIPFVMVSLRNINNNKFGSAFPFPGSALEKI